MTTDAHITDLKSFIQQAKSLLGTYARLRMRYKEVTERMDEQLVIEKTLENVSLNTK